jgi:hypothetical protein
VTDAITLRGVSHRFGDPCTGLGTPDGTALLAALRSG